MERHPLTQMDAIDLCGWIAPMNPRYDQDMSQCAPALEVHERHNGKPSGVEVFHRPSSAGETRQKSCPYLYLYLMGLVLYGTENGPRKKQGRGIFLTVS